MSAFTVQRWHHAMCKRGQRPVLIDMGYRHDTGQRELQISVFGDGYDHPADYHLWHWMRQHSEEVTRYLTGLGSIRYVWGGRARPIGTASGMTPAQEADAIITAADRANFHLCVWIDDRGRERIGANTPLVDGDLNPLPEPFCDRQAWEQVIIPGLKKLRPVIADLLWQRQAGMAA